MKKTLLVIDWASLSYHQVWALGSKLNTATILYMETAEEQLTVWRQSMVNQTLGFIKDFNPLDVYLSAEGSDIWRKHYVTNYYNNNTKLHYDKKGYQVVFDNVLVKLTKDASGDIIPEKSNLKKSGKDLPEKFIMLDTAPDTIKNYIWDNQIVPKYKGNRNKEFWPFAFEKKVWRDYKETFATEIAPLFRGNVIGIPEAEGDDSIYVVINYLSEKYDEVILVTGDSDMNQLLTNKKLRIYNHKTREFVARDNPIRERDIKILSGDTSDNIKGIGLAENALRLGEKGAITLLDSVGDIYTAAKAGGWINQFTKNQMLVNLEFIPTDIQRKLCEVIDTSKPELKSLEELEDVGSFNLITDKTINELKNLGYYTLLDRESVLENDSYKGGKLEGNAWQHRNKAHSSPDLTNIFDLNSNELDDILADDPLEI